MIEISPARTLRAPLANCGSSGLLPLSRNSEFERE
jgi:hypothetical protein